MGKEVYSYIVGSIDLINKSIIVQEQNQVTLFSYMYNRQNTMLNRIDMIETNVKKIKSSLTDIDKRLNTINDKILNIEKDYNKKCNKLDIKTVSEINILKTEISDIRLQLDKINNNKLSYKINNKIHGLKDKIDLLFKNIKDKSNVIVSFIKNRYKSIYNVIYKLLFKKKIQQQMIEEARRKEEEERKKKIENLNKIKEILNKPNKPNKNIKK